MSNNNATDMTFVPATDSVGVEVRGVDLRKPLNNEAFGLLEDAFDRHGVMFVRGQHLEAEDQIAFARRFGELQVNFNSDLYGLPALPEIFVIGNIEEDGKALALKGVGNTWHSDMCYTATPPRATLLYALEVPQLHGLTLGDTCFASAAAAWDALPATMQQQLEGKRATFDFRERKRSRPVSAETVAQYPPVEHPIVRVHPATGRKSLYVMRDDCTAINDLPDDEAQRLIAALAEHILRPEFVYRHQWQPGDLLMWDNCTVQHRAIADYALPQRRCMYRTTIAGNRPR
jgi:taurine dioxygenase